MTKMNLCRCNNCMTILKDNNPQFNAHQYNVIDNEIVEQHYYGGCIEDTDDNLIGVWVCPNCRTDEYFMDYQDIIKKEQKYNKVRI